MKILSKTIYKLKIQFIYNFSKKVCVEKDWQGVVFVMMDKLKGAGIEYIQTIEVGI